MNTLEKVEAKLEEAQDLDDAELHLIPFLPPALVRGALRFVAKRLPDDPREMEAHVHQALAFLNGLLPDPEDVPELLEAGSVEVSVETSTERSGEPPEPEPEEAPECLPE